MFRGSPGKRVEQEIDQVGSRKNDSESAVQSWNSSQTMGGRTAAPRTGPVPGRFRRQTEAAAIRPQNFKKSRRLTPFGQVFLEGRLMGILLQIFLVLIRQNLYQG